MYIWDLPWSTERELMLHVLFCGWVNSPKIGGDKPFHMGTRGRTCTRGCSVIASRRKVRALSVSCRHSVSGQRIPFAVESSVQDGTWWDRLLLQFVSLKFSHPEATEEKQRHQIGFPKIFFKKIWIRATSNLDNVILKLKVSWFFCCNHLGKICLSTFQRKEGEQKSAFFEWDRPLR